MSLHPVLVDQDRMLRKGLKLQHLRLIVALRATGQVGTAATRLNMAQPAASRLLAQLEEIVGSQLYSRHARGIELTTFGERLAERAGRILRDLDDVDREIAELSAGYRGSVSVGSVTGPALEVIMPVIRQIRLTRPMIDVTIIVETSGKLVDALLEGEIDFAIGRILGDVNPDLFDERRIGEEPLSLIVRTGHPLQRRKSLTLDDCVEFDWIMQTREGLLTQTVERYLVAAGVPLPHQILRTSSLLMTLAMIGQSNAIAPVSSSVADFYGASSGLSGQIATLPVAADLHVSAYSLLRMKGRDLSPAAQEFHDAVLRRLEATDVN